MWLTFPKQERLAASLISEKLPCTDDCLCSNLRMGALSGIWCMQIVP